MAWQNFTRTEQDNELPFDNISPCDSVPLGLSKTINCLLTISVHVAAFQGDKPLRYPKHEPNFVFRLKNSSRGPWQEPPDIGLGTRTVLRRQSLRGFISDGWPEGAEPPERVQPSERTSPSGDASSTLIWFCRATPFYACFSVKHLKGTCTFKVKHLKGTCTFEVARQWQPCFLWLLGNNKLFFRFVVDEHYQIPWSLCNHLTSNWKSQDVYTSCMRCCFDTRKATATPQTADRFVCKPSIHLFPRFWRISDVFFYASLISDFFG